MSTLEWKDTDVFECLCYSNSVSCSRFSPFSSEIFQKTKKTIFEFSQMIFCSLIQSQLSYCVSIYGGAAKSILDPLVKIQKRAFRLVNEAHPSKHTDHMFATAGCLKFQDMHKWACARICVKYFNDNLQINILPNHEFLPVGAG